MALKEDFQQAISKTTSNSEKLDVFVNGRDTDTYATDDGTLVDSLRTMMRKIGETITSHIASITQAKNDAEAAATTAQDAVTNLSNGLLPDQVLGTHIKDGEISSDELAGNAVTQDKIADGAILASKIADGVLGTVANKNVGTAEGDVPLLGADGLIPEGMLPDIDPNKPPVLAYSGAIYLTSTTNLSVACPEGYSYLAFVAVMNARAGETFMVKADTTQSNLTVFSMSQPESLSHSNFYFMKMTYVASGKGQLRIDQKGVRNLANNSWINKSGDSSYQIKSIYWVA